jgi:hypothetical protein
MKTKKLKKKNRKNRLERIATTVRKSRTAKVFAIVAAVWIALLVGFVGASWMAAKTQEHVTLNPQSSEARPRISLRMQHSRAATKRMPENASASNSVAPCLPLPATSNERPSSSLATPILAQDQAHNDQIRNNLPVDPSEHRDRQYQDRSRTATPVVPYPGISRVPAVIWVSAAATPYNRSVQTRVVLAQGANVAVSLTAQHKSEGFRPFQKQVETGKQTSPAGFQPFRH